MIPMRIYDNDEYSFLLRKLKLAITSKQHIYKCDEIVLGMNWHGLPNGE